MSLEMKSNCERCKGLLYEYQEAFICSHECTFCNKCTTELKKKCPNCSGELVERPKRMNIFQTGNFEETSF
jgi:hypothetical protein